ncbi:hypothetical protein ES703_124639 [subsurface metagenome]
MQSPKIQVPNQKWKPPFQDEDRSGSMSYLQKSYILQLLRMGKLKDIKKSKSVYIQHLRNNSCFLQNIKVIINSFLLHPYQNYGGLLPFFLAPSKHLKIQVYFIEGIGKMLFGLPSYRLDKFFLRHRRNQYPPYNN